MTKAFVNGVECIIYDYEMCADSGLTICRVKYPCYPTIVPVIAELIEVCYDV